MPAYWLSRANIYDPVEYKILRPRRRHREASRRENPLARQPLPDHGGAEEIQTLRRIEFPIFEAAVGCYNSPEYQAAAKYRKNGAGEVENVIVDSGDVS